MFRFQVIKALVVGLFFVGACGCVNSEPRASSRNTDALISDACMKRKANVRFPLRVEHDYGATVINRKPRRVALYSQMDNNNDVLLALDIVPVATSGVARIDDLPKWQIEKLNSLKAKPAIVNPYMDQYLQEIRLYKPDIIVMDSSEQIGGENYKKLSKMAPVVPIPGYFENQGGMEDELNEVECKIRMYARVLGIPQKGERFIKKIRSTIRKSIAAHAALKKKNIALVKFDFEKNSILCLGDGGYYESLLHKIGFPKHNNLEQCSHNEKEISAMSSVDFFSDIDVFVPYLVDNFNSEDIAKLQADKYIGKIPAIKKGRIVLFNSNEDDYKYIDFRFPLSIPWGLEKYLDLLEKTSKK